MKLFRLFLSLTFLILGACSTKTEIIRESGGAGVPYGPPPGANDVMGPGDSGGGAGINGVPLESFKTALPEQDFYKNVIDVVIKRLAPVHLGLASDLHHIATERKWYIVPVPLNKIPALKMGIHFIETEQLALQNLDTIWIERKAFYQKMSDTDRSLLILHELLMGVRLLEFTDAADLCYAKAAKIVIGSSNIADADKVQSEHKKARSECARQYRKWDMTSDRQKISISATDYDNIRNMATELYDRCFNIPEDSKTCDLQADELEAWIINKKFRRY